MDERPFQLDSKSIDALPLVNHILERLGMERLLRKHMPPTDLRAKLSSIQVLGVLLRNLVLCRVPLYGLQEWTSRMVPKLVGLTQDQVILINDDRLGRSLDRLFDADRQALVTDLVVHMVKTFHVDLAELHNDSTTLSLHGAYNEATGELMRGKPTLVANRGHSKDHRPDLKQLLWILTISADGAVPIHFKVADGNTEDSTTHIETWQILRRLVGTSKFLYVADSKLCTRDNLRHIDRHKGKFVTIMPRSRKEDSLFRDWLQQSTQEWQEICRKPHRRLADGPPDIFRAMESPIPDTDGFRIVWYHSSHKAERDAERRSNIIQTAWKALEQLQSKLQGARPRFHTRGAVAKATETILQEADATRWISYDVTVVEDPSFRQETRGRPGKDTRWRRQVKTRFQLTWSLREDRVVYDRACDGVFPLMTNYRSEEASAATILDAYKSKQPFVEKRHDLLKNLQAATPIYLKNIGRIEALLFLQFTALLVHALIERQIRRAMTDQQLHALGLYPEGRPCVAPSARRIFDLFDGVQRHHLTQQDRIIQCFEPELTEQQLEIVQLLGVSPTNLARA